METQVSNPTSQTPHLDALLAKYDAAQKAEEARKNREDAEAERLRAEEEAAWAQEARAWFENYLGRELVAELLDGTPPVVYPPVNIHFTTRFADLSLEAHHKSGECWIKGKYSNLRLPVRDELEVGQLIATAHNQQERVRREAIDRTISNIQHPYYDGESEIEHSVQCPYDLLIASWPDAADEVRPVLEAKLAEIATAKAEYEDAREAAREEQERVWHPFTLFEIVHATTPADSEPVVESVYSTYPMTLLGWWPILDHGEIVSMRIPCVLRVEEKYIASPEAAPHSACRTTCKAGVRIVYPPENVNE
ncbi:MAG TPA: hypothetical protein VIK33_17465 [Anaerolineae bacterium]